MEMFIFCSLSLTVRLRGYIPIQSCVCSLIRNRSQCLRACIYICLLVGIFVQGLLYLATGRHHSVIVFASLTPRQKDEFSQRTVESGSLSFFAARERSRVELRDMLSYSLPAPSPSVFTPSDFICIPKVFCFSTLTTYITR